MLQRDSLKCLLSRLRYVLPCFLSTTFIVLGLCVTVQAQESPQEADSWPEDSWFSEDAEPAPAPQQDMPEDKASWLDKLDINGYLKNETAYRYDEPRSITKLRNIFYINAGYPLDDNKNIVFSAWTYYDLVYDLFDYETIAARFVRDSDKPLVFLDNLAQEKDSGVADIRELYIDIFGENLDLRIGKQFVIWGVFDGMRVTDEINPLDFRELILPDLLDYRIPLWTLKADYYQDDGSWEFLWIPDIRFHKPAPSGSEWELLQEVSNTTFPNSFTLRNSEYGIRYSREILNTKFSFSYFYTWDDFPVIFRTVKVDSSIDPFFFPTYTRINIYGLTFVRPMGATILKGEFAYVPDKYFGLIRDTDRDNDGYLDSEGELQLEHYRWALGVDFNLWGIDFSPALSQWIIVNHDKNLIQDKFDTSFTLFARKPLPEHSAVMQLLAIALLNMDELYLKPKVGFNITDRFGIAVGMDLFYGSRSTLGVTSSGGAVANLGAVEQSAQFFGNFHNNDRIFVEFKYTF